MMTVSLRRRVLIIVINELMPGIWDSTPPILESILANMDLC
jgi:hypothetical protein